MRAKGPRKRLLAHTYTYHHIITFSLASAAECRMQAAIHPTTKINGSYFWPQGMMIGGGVPTIRSEGETSTKRIHLSSRVYSPCRVNLKYLSSADDRQGVPYWTESSECLEWTKIHITGRGLNVVGRVIQVQGKKERESKKRRIEKKKSNALNPDPIVVYINTQA
jgi:hypothetical protein